MSHQPEGGPTAGAPPIADPTPIGLICLAIGCAALTPFGFGVALTPAGLKTAAIFCLLFGAGGQAVAGTNRYAMFDLLAPITYSRAYRDAHAGVLADRRAAVAALPDHWFEGTSSLLASMAELDLRPLLGRIRCPTLVLRAEFDDIMPAERTRALARSIHGAEEVLVNGSGHALVVEKPAEFLAAAVRFLDAHPLAGGGPRSRG